jgi:hypothetical protein
VKDGRIIENGRHGILVSVEGGAYVSLVALHFAAPSYVATTFRRVRIGSENEN